MEEMMTLKEFAEKHNCNYDYASRRLKQLMQTDPEMKNHAVRKGTRFQLDEYAEAALIPQKRYRKRSESLRISRSHFVRLAEERQNLLEKQKAINEEIRQKETELQFKQMELINEVVFRCLGREYRNNDEIRLEVFLKNSENFKNFMNANLKEE